MCQWVTVSGFAVQMATNIQLCLLWKPPLCSNKTLFLKTNRGWPPLASLCFRRPELRHSTFKGWGCGSVVEHLPGRCRAQHLIPSLGWRELVGYQLCVDMLPLQLVSLPLAISICFIINSNIKNQYFMFNLNIDRQGGDLDSATSSCVNLGG